MNEKLEDKHARELLLRGFEARSGMLCSKCMIVLPRGYKKCLSCELETKEVDVWERE